MKKFNVHISLSKKIHQPRYRNKPIDSKTQLFCVQVDGLEEDFLQVGSNYSLDSLVSLSLFIALDHDLLRDGYHLKHIGVDLI